VLARVGGLLLYPVSQEAKRHALAKALGGSTKRGAQHAPIVASRFLNWVDGFRALECRTLQRISAKKPLIRPRARDFQPARDSVPLIGVVR